MSESTIVVAAGLYIGILGLIIAAGSSDIARNSGAAIGLGVFTWIIGGIFLLGAYIVEARAGKTP